VLRRSLPGSNSRDGPVHAVAAAAAARWRENSSRVGEDIAAAASLEAAARAMAAEVGGGTLLCNRHEGEWGPCGKWF